MCGQRGFNRPHNQQAGQRQVYRPILLKRRQEFKKIIKINMNKTKIKFLVPAFIAALAATLFANSASAVDLGKNCEIGIHPYDLQASSEEAFPYVPNYVSPDSACENELRYPGTLPADLHNYATTDLSYKTVPPNYNANLVKQNDENKRVSWAVHEHGYYNAKDATSSEELFYYKAPIDKFEITIQPDGNTNLDLGNVLENLYCHTPKPASEPESIVDPIKDCEGQVDALYGGTKVTKTRSGNKVIVSWEFGRIYNSKKPVLFANNGAGFVVTDSNGNPACQALSNPYSVCRKLEHWLNFKTKNIQTSDIWSASTTSRILLADMAIRKSHFEAHKTDGCVDNNVNNANSGWCYLDPTTNPDTANYPVQNVTKADPGKDAVTRKYYWYPLVSVGTIWKKPPPQEKVCNGLTIAPTSVQASTPTLFSVTPSFSGTGTTPELDYKWSATNGQFKDSQTTGSYADPPVYEKDDNGVEDTNSYYSGSNGTATTIDVIAVKEGTTTEIPACKATLNIPPTQQGQCLQLNPTAISLPILPGNTVQLSATPTYSQPAQPDRIRWSETGNGYFTNVPGAPATCTTPAAAAVGAAHSANTEILAPHDCIYNYTAGSAGDTVSMEAVPNTPFAASCRADYTVQQQGEKPWCVALNLTPPTLYIPGQTILNATVTYSDQSTHDTTVSWSQTGGNPLPTTSEQHQSGPSSSPYIYYNTYTNNGTSGTVHAWVSAFNDPNVDIGKSGDCATGITHSNEVQNPYCLNLDLQPSQLNDSGSTPLTAHVTYSNGLDYDTTVQWSGDNGTYLNGLSTQTKTDNSVNLFNNTFTITDEGDQASASAAVTAIPGHPDWSLGNCNQAKTIYTPPQEDECDWVDWSWSGNSICVDYNDEYTGGFTWKIGNNHTVTGICSPAIPSDTEWSFYATREPDNRLCKDNGRTPPRPPTLEKEVRRANRDPWTSILNVTTSEQYVDYRLIFTPSPGTTTTATITDPIGTGGVPGFTYGDAGKQEGGDILWADNMRIWEEGRGDLRTCSSLPEDAPVEHCYNGTTPNNLQLVKVTGRVEITYSGRINGSLTNADCVAGKICQQKFTNETKANWWIYDEDGNEIGRSTEPLYADATVQQFCQYILTRAAGDIFLETDLNAGVDIRKCSKYTTTPGLVVVPAPPSTPSIVSTGTATSNIFTIEHEICTEGQAGTLSSDLQKYYGQTVSGLSSQICEVKLKPGTAWQQSTITNNIKENKTRISRWDADYENQDINMSTITRLNPEEYASKEVYRIKGGNLTIDEPYTLSDSEGAKTFIIEDGDLIIKNDIKYGPCNKAFCTVSDIASLGFIVLNGNVIVDNDVTEISGVYFVQEGDNVSGTSQTGRLVSDPSDVPSENQLFIYGSVYGDIRPLFLNRVFAGDPALGGAGIVVRFDERIILNTPPGLRDVLSFSQGEVAR
jgi:hypothetical protein